MGITCRYVNGGALVCNYFRFIAWSKQGGRKKFGYIGNLLEEFRP